MMMSVYSPVYHAMVSSPVSGPAESLTVSASKPGNADTGEDFFHHILDVINPLQHLPVIGTIYRAITGEHIGPIEKIAGDALYGGLWGAVSSVADVAFEGITGKSFEDTALAWIKGDDKMQVASRKVTAPVIASIDMPLSAEMPALPAPDRTMASAIPSIAAGPDIAALTSALSAKGVDSETANRALYAYRRSMGMTAQQSVFASVN
ncbi:MAG: hypothetical protein JF627_00830 [Alphaproteobacteria bacterium]|nr:hypothetical protein [Alphaproteobacteria bacterium]